VPGAVAAHAARETRTSLTLIHFDESIGGLLLTEDKVLGSILLWRRRIKGNPQRRAG
jgi:hypothetical protein